jgi:hypothetical protein
VNLPPCPKARVVNALIQHMRAAHPDILT